MSLDSLDDAVFARLNDVDFPVARVLEGIEAADRAGLHPIKVNMVVRRGLNEDSVLPMARFARERGYTLRFIEYMDVGHTNGWALDEVVPSAEVVGMHRRRAAPGAAGATVPRRGRDALALSRRPRRGRRHQLGHAAVLRRLHAGPAHRGGWPLHLPVRHARAPTCGRRCAMELMTPALRALLADVWSRRSDRYSELRSEATAGLPRVEMSRIGG